MNRIPYKILIITNSIKRDISNDIALFKQFVEDRTPLELSIRYIVTDLPLSSKSFGIKDAEGNELYGLNGIKDQLRALKIIPDYWYHSVFFIYDSGVGMDSEVKLANWTYFDPIVVDTQFTEIVSSVHFPVNDVFRVMSHEIFHVWHARARRAGVPTFDTMDTYLDEFNPYSTTGNRAINLAEIDKQVWIWEKITHQPALQMILALFSRQLELIALQVRKLFMPVYISPVPEVPSVPELQRSKIEEWADSIKEHEGWFVGSRSHRNNNPGNLKFVGQVLAIGRDDKGFCIFKTYEDGYQTLCKMLRRAATGGSQVYKPTMTLLQFFATYAPSSDDNDPDSYANRVAKKLNVPVTTQIKDLL